MKKLRTVVKNIDRLVRHQADTTELVQLVGRILTRGFFGRMKWLLFGR
jgi:hypothetical protein